MIINIIKKRICLDKNFTFIAIGLRYFDCLFSLEVLYVCIWIGSNTIARFISALQDYYGSLVIFPISLRDFDCFSLTDCFRDRTIPTLSSIEIVSSQLALNTVLSARSIVGKTGSWFAGEQIKYFFVSKTISHICQFTVAVANEVQCAESFYCKLSFFINISTDDNSIEIERRNIVEQFVL